MEKSISSEAMTRCTHIPNLGQPRPYSNGDMSLYTLFVKYGRGQKIICSDLVLVWTHCLHLVNLYSVFNELCPSVQEIFKDKFIFNVGQKSNYRSQWLISAMTHHFH